MQKLERIELVEKFGKRNNFKVLQQEVPVEFNNGNKVTTIVLNLGSLSIAVSSDKNGKKTKLVNDLFKCIMNKISTCDKYVSEADNVSINGYDRVTIRKVRLLSTSYTGLNMPSLIKKMQIDNFVTPDVSLVHSNYSRHYCVTTWNTFDVKLMHFMYKDSVIVDNVIKILNGDIAEITDEYVTSLLDDTIHTRFFNPSMSIYGQYPRQVQLEQRPYLPISPIPCESRKDSYEKQLFDERRKDKTASKIDDKDATLDAKTEMLEYLCGDKLKEECQTGGTSEEVIKE